MNSDFYWTKLGIEQIEIFFAGHWVECELFLLLSLTKELKKKDSERGAEARDISKENFEAGFESFILLRTS